MAPTGQVSAQEPQKHEAELRFDQAQREELADEPFPAGQPPSQAPQLMQVSLIAYAIVYTSERYVANRPYFITNGQKCNRNFSAGAGV